MTDNFNTKQVNEQIEKSFAGPVRNYAGLVLDYTEKAAELQYNAVKAYMDIGLQQAREFLDIKDQNDIQAYVAKQPQVAQTVADRVRGDVEKVVELQKDFAEKSRKVVEDGASSAAKSANATQSSGSSAAQKSASASK